MTDQFTLASILCSRLCHDLVNPVGAVNNGIEILVDEDDPEMQKQVLNLLEQSTRQVSNRLQFFRLAFGAASGMQQSLPVDDLKRAAEAFFAEGKVTLDWQPQVSELTKDGAKVLLNLVLVAGESLIRGGSVTVLATSNGGGVVMDVKAEGQRVLLADGVHEALSGGADVKALSPKAAPAFLAREISLSAGGAFDWSEGDGSQLALTATL